MKKRLGSDRSREYSGVFLESFPSSPKGVTRHGPPKLERQLDSAPRQSHVMKRKQGLSTSPSQSKKTKEFGGVLFQDLLDFSQGVKREEDIERRFKLVAVTLLHGFHENAKEIEFEIL